MYDIQETEKEILAFKSTPYWQVFITISDGKNKTELKNSRGVACIGCGNPMDQTAPNCYECKNCGDKLGGCGI